MLITTLITILWLVLNNFTKTFEYKIEFLLQLENMLKNVELNFFLEIIGIIMLINYFIKYEQKKKIIVFLSSVSIFLICKNSYWDNIFSREYNLELSFENFSAPFHPIFLNIGLSYIGVFWVFSKINILYQMILMFSIAILLGCFWAYMELGWGGFWAYDEIENFSLLLFLFSIVSIIEHQKTSRTSIGLKFFDSLIIILLFFFGKFFITNSLHKFSHDLFLEFETDKFNKTIAVSIILSITITAIAITWKLANSWTINRGKIKEILLNNYNISLIFPLLIVQLLANFQVMAMAVIVIDKIILTAIVLLNLSSLRFSHVIILFIIITMILNNNNLDSNTIYINIPKEEFLFLNNTKIINTTKIENVYLNQIIDFGKSNVNIPIFYLKNKNLGYCEILEKTLKQNIQGYNIIY